MAAGPQRQTGSWQSLIKMYFEAEIHTGIKISLMGARIMKESEMTARLEARAPKRETKRDQFCRN